MSHYDNVKTVSKTIGDQLVQLTRDMGILPDIFVVKHNQIHHMSVSDVNVGIYGRALLHKGVTYDERLVLANVPYEQFDIIVKNNLEQVFDVLGIPSSQCECHKLAKSFARRSCFEILQREKFADIFNIPVFKSELEKFAKWCQKADVAIQKMEANVKLLASVTREEHDFGELCYFDWHYGYSDDVTVRRSGSARHKQVVEFVNKTLAEKPHLRHVVEVIAEANGFNPEFFTRA